MKLYRESKTVQGIGTPMPHQVVDRTLESDKPVMKATRIDKDICDRHLCSRQKEPSQCGFGGADFAATRTYDATS